jgi:hypothetical protein
VRKSLLTACEARYSDFMIILTNQRPSLLDLSAIYDTKGVAVVLAPKGQRGDSRKCAAEVADHPDVLAFQAAGWVTVTAANPVPANKLASRPVPAKLPLVPVSTPEAVVETVSPPEPPVAPEPAPAPPEEPPAPEELGATPFPAETPEQTIERLEAEDAAPADAVEPQDDGDGRGGRRRKKNRG